MKRFYLSIFCGLMVSYGLAQPTLNWENTQGGAGDDFANGPTIQLSDGQYLALGSSSSQAGSGNRTAPSYGFQDAWMVKLDSEGNKLWDKSFGGVFTDVIYDALALEQGGAVLFGYSNSPGTSATKSSPNLGGSDYWLIKIDNEGNKLWEKSYGGSSEDFGWSLDQCSDGGFILAGYSISPMGGDKSQNGQGSYDYWVIKTDSEGNKLWDRSFGGSDLEALRDVIQSSDGGFVLSGYSKSPASGDKSENNLSTQDLWLVKLDASGNLLWENTLRSQAVNFRGAITELNGAYYVCDRAGSSGGDQTAIPKGSFDYWLVKIDASTGNQLWDKSLGGTAYDEGIDIQLSPDHQLLLLGRSSSNVSGDKSEASRGGDDNWLIKVDPEGNKVWDKTVGSPGADPVFYTSLLSEDNGKITVASHSSSLSAGGEQSQASFGGFDYWVYQLQDNSLNQAPQIISFNFPLDPTLVNTEVQAQIQYLDDNLLHAQLNWGDGTISSAEFSDGLIQASHQYSTPGVYEVLIRLEDSFGESVEESFQYIVIYNPAEGFVTGGGWIPVKAGDYPAEPSLQGKANFGFVAKYKKGSNIPDGNTQFNFKVAGLDFQSESYEWLVISDNKARYKGQGSLNGLSGYGFMISALDGTPDKFRIKIWDNQDQVVFDNQLGAAEDAEVSTALGGGSIRIHRKKNTLKPIRSDNDQTSSPDFTLSPNPAHQNQIWVEFESPQKGSVEWQMYNTQGQVIAQGREQFQSEEKGFYILLAPGSHSGMHFIRLKGTQNSFKTHRVLIQK